MELSFYTFFLLPAGLGLLGFIEPCTIGGHLLFLETQKTRTRIAKMEAVAVFVAARSLVAGLFGAVMASLGRLLIDVQTGIWLVFGLIYLTIGVAFLIGKSRVFKKSFTFAPSTWKQAKNPLVLGLAFGLNVPACAAPILFGLLGLAATTGTILTGFMMMFIFGFFLSTPLVIFASVPSMAARLDRLGAALKQRRWIIGAIFVALGIWSIWFGLFVDPENWSGK